MYLIPWQLAAITSILLLPTAFALPLTWPEDEVLFVRDDVRSDTLFKREDVEVFRRQAPRGSADKTPSSQTATNTNATSRNNAPPPPPPRLSSSSRQSPSVLVGSTVTLPSMLKPTDPQPSPETKTKNSRRSSGIPTTSRTSRTPRPSSSNLPTEATRFTQLPAGVEHTYQYAPGITATDWFPTTQGLVGPDTIVDSAPPQRSTFTYGLGLPSRDSISQSGGTSTPRQQPSSSSRPTDKPGRSSRSRESQQP